MRTDIAIIGGGLAGSTAAAMLGRAGIDTILIDPHEIFPPDFRCEKLDSTQVNILRKTGIADQVLAATTADRTFWTARFGRLIESALATSTASCMTISSTPCARQFLRTSRARAQ